jgi:hypothetical protein
MRDESNLSRVMLTQLWGIGSPNHANLEQRSSGVLGDRCRHFSRIRVGWNLVRS